MFASVLPGRRAALVLAALMASCAAVTAAPLKTGDVVPLWPAAAPGSAGLTIKEVVTERSKDPAILDRAYTQITAPTLTAFVPDKPNGTAVIVAPGGAYMRVVFDKEGVDVAKAFGARGVTTFVLKYRLPGEGHERASDVPLEDAQRALRLVGRRGRRGRRGCGLQEDRLRRPFSDDGHRPATIAPGRRC